MLKSSLPWILHIGSINVIFFDGLNCLVLRVASSLDAFRTYPSVRSCPACFITTGKPEAPEYRSSRTRYSFHSDNNAPSRYHTNCLAYLIKTYLFVLCGLYLHPFHLLSLSSNCLRSSLTSIFCFTLSKSVSAVNIPQFNINAKASTVLSPFFLTIVFSNADP